MWRFLKLFTNKERRTFDAGSLGILKYCQDNGENNWQGILVVEGINLHVELSIETLLAMIPSRDQVNAVVGFFSDYHQLQPLVTRHIYESFSRTPYALSPETFDKMYYLGGVTLKKNGDWWVVLEPADVPSSYNLFIRFTIRKGEIVWANLG